MSATSDGGKDAGSDVLIPTSCFSDSDCSAGYACRYPATDYSCKPAKKCFPAPPCSKGYTACACDNTDVEVCNGGASKPVWSEFACEGPLCGTDPACEVCDVSTFSPLAQAKPLSASGACSIAQIIDFVNACLDANATQTTCSAWQQTDAGACVPCVFTQATAATWGPLVCDNNACSLNHSGCIDVTLGQVSLENSTSTGSCGDYYNAAEGCIATACAACTSPSDQSTCASDATASECKTYADAAMNAKVCTSVDAGATVCFPQTDTEYVTFVNVFCGTGP